MEVIMEAVLLAAISLLIFYDLGFLVPVTKEDGKTSVCETILSGFLVYIFAFEVIALFATWMSVPQNIYFYIWGCVLSVLIVFSLVWNIGKWWHRVNIWIKNLSFHPLLIGAVLGVIGECAYAISRRSGSQGIVAQMATDLSTNTLSVYSPATGDAVTTISTASLLSRIQLNGEFYSSLLGIHPGTYAHVTGSIITVILSSMIVYRIGVRLLDGNRLYASLMLLIVILANVFFTSQYTASFLLLESGFSKDAMLANIILPLYLLLALMIYEEKHWRHLFLLVVFVGIAGFCISEYAFYMIPVMTLAAFLPVTVAGKKWIGILWTVLIFVMMSGISLFVYLIPNIPFGH